MAESDFVRRIRRYLDSVEGCFSWKEHGGMYGTAGIPDVICCLRGKFIAFEAKVPGNKPTRLQEKTIERINGCGGIAKVVYTLDEVKSVVESVLGGEA